MLNTLNTDEKFAFPFSYIQNENRDGPKKKRDPPKHKNNKLCSHSRFTYQKCNSIRWIDWQLSPYRLQRLNRINAICFAICKLISVVSTIPRHKNEDIFSKQLQPKENATGRKAVPLERANFSSEVQECKNVYYISKACHNP